MAVTYKVRVGEKGLLYLPVSIRRKLNIEKGGELLLIVEDDRIVLRPIKTIFCYALETKGKIVVSVEEFESESEKMQRELYGEQ